MCLIIGGVIPEIYLLIIDCDAGIKRACTRHWRNALRAGSLSCPRICNILGLRGLTQFLDPVVLRIAVLMIDTLRPYPVMPCPNEMVEVVVFSVETYALIAIWTASASSNRSDHALFPGVDLPDQRSIRTIVEDVTHQGCVDLHLQSFFGGFSPRSVLMCFFLVSTTHLSSALWPFSKLPKRLIICSGDNTISPPAATIGVGLPWPTSPPRAIFGAFGVRL